MPFQALATETLERLRRCTKERLIEPWSSDGRDVGQRGWQREYNVKVWNRDEVLLFLFDPVEGPSLKATPTVPVSTGVEGGDLVAA